MKVEDRVRDLERQMVTWQKLCCDLATHTAKRFAKIALRIEKLDKIKMNKKAKP